MRLEKLRSWWRNLPTEKRVKLIASVLLVFAGTEVFVLAPFVFEVAALIDAFGLLFVLGLAGGWLRSQGGVLWMQIANLWRTVLHWADRFADFGLAIPLSWHLRFGAIFGPPGRVVTRVVAGLAVLMIVGKLPIWRW